MLPVNQPSPSYHGLTEYTEYTLGDPNSTRNGTIEMKLMPDEIKIFQ